MQEMHRNDKYWDVRLPLEKRREKERKKNLSADKVRRQDRTSITVDAAGYKRDIPHSFVRTMDVSDNPELRCLTYIDLSSVAI